MKSSSNNHLKVTQLYLQSLPNQNHTNSKGLE